MMQKTTKALGALALALPMLAFAQAWPSKPVTLIVPFPAGGGTDTFARPLSVQLTKQTGKQWVVDNRGGAGGTLGAGLAAKSAPDGYTFFMGGAHHAIAPSMYPKLDYNLERDFIPVALLASPPQVVVVNGKSPFNTLQDLLKFSKANPGKLNYASAGNGSAHHLAGEQFKQLTKTFMTHIPYKGAGPALSDLMAGQVDVMFDGLGSSSQHIRSGRIKALAVAANKRSAAFPNVPTAAEVGVPGYEVSTWYGLWAPKGTPKEVIDKASAELRKAFASAEVQQAWQKSGSDIPNLYGDAFGRFVTSEIVGWSKVAKTSGAKLD